MNLLPDPPDPSSKQWNPTTKLVVMLSAVAVLVYFLAKFQYVLGPLLLAFIFSYLFHPVVRFLNMHLRLPWRLATTILYLIVFLLIVGGMAWGSVTLVTQVQNLIGFIQSAITTSLPNLITELTQKPLVIGPFQWNLANFDLTALSNQLLANIQPIITQTGGLVGSIATGAAGVIGWFLFSYMLSYFLLVETGGARSQLIRIRIPGYTEDFDRLGKSLGRIWNAFLRGQLIILAVTILFYMAFFGMAGLQFYYGLAVLAGISLFVPYIGPFIAWVTYGLVAYFQGSTIFGLSPLAYALIIVGIAMLVDNIVGQVINPRIMADALQVHPGIILLAFIIGANLLGIFGMLLAAPVAASMKLLAIYLFSKLFDKDPWEVISTPNPPKPLPKFLQRIANWFGSGWDVALRKTKVRP